MSPSIGKYCYSRVGVQVSRRLPKTTGVCKMFTRRLEGQVEGTPGTITADEKLESSYTG